MIIIYQKTILITILSLLFITGCTNNSSNTLTPTEQPNLELTKLSTNNKADQNAANEAKEIISHFEEVSGVRAINHNKQLLIAIEVNHIDRFNLKDIEKELQKKANSSFENMEVTLSTDKKLFIELKKLEIKLTNDSISEKELSEEINKLKALMKEET